MALIAGLAAFSCGDEAPIDREPWLDAPTSEWPDLVFTNDLGFSDTTYSGIANAFLVAHGADTLVATVKHIFTFLAEVEGLSSIDLGPDFREWTLRSSRDSDLVLGDLRLLNGDPSEGIGDYQSLKDRDWLFLEAEGLPSDAFAFGIRESGVESGEAVFAIGRTQAARERADPTIWPLRVFRTAGHHFYVQPEHSEANPAGSSGSPVIDRNGRLVGILSGASGRLGVVTSTSYLRVWAEQYR